MASQKTPVRGRPYPAETDVPDVAADLQALADSVDTAPTVGVGTLANRPASAAPGDRYLVEGDPAPAQNGIEYVWASGGWVQLRTFPASPLRTVTAATTIVSTDLIVQLDASGGAFAQALPAASSWTGKLTLIALATNSDLVTLTPNGTDTVTSPGKASQTSLTLGSPASGAPYQAVDLLPDTSVTPATWRIV